MSTPWLMNCESEMKNLYRNTHYCYCVQFSIFNSSGPHAFGLWTEHLGRTCKLHTFRKKKKNLSLRRYLPKRITLWIKRVHISYILVSKVYPSMTAFVSVFLRLTERALSSAMYSNFPGAVGSHLCCGAREQLGVRCPAQGHLSRGIE